MSIQDGALKIFYTRSLKSYKTVLEFISAECLDPSPRRALFLLPHVRTLLDIYSRLLDLQIRTDENKKALICIAYQLYSYKTFNSPGESQKTIDLYRDFLIETHPNFPEKLADLSWRWLERNELIFSRRNDILTPENMSRYSDEATVVFGTEKVYEIYSFFSEMLHGNPYYYNDEAHNERFWVVSMAQVNTAFLIELIDRYLLDRGVARDFRDWLAKNRGAKDRFVRVWIRERGTRQAV